jgi:hypothetical protein
MRVGKMLLFAENKFFYNSQRIRYFKRYWRWKDITKEKLKSLEKVKIAFIRIQILVSYNNNIE